MDDSHQVTAAEEWDAQFERETGKTIRDGRLAFKDPQGAAYRAIMEFRKLSCVSPKRLRMSVGVHRDLLMAMLGDRRFMGGEIETFMGIPTETDYTFPEGMMVVD